MTARPELFRDAETLADHVVERVGKHIVLGLPLGLGKANHLANALFARAQADPSISLTILTALTLEPPTGDNALMKRFLEPTWDRFFGGYPRLEYARALQEKRLPANVSVHEFFLQPGKWLGNAQVQQDYISLNYTHALNHLLQSGINVIGQLVVPPPHAENGTAAERYSLSCNPDITADLYDIRRDGKLECLVVGQVNRHLPFMGGAADRSAADFDCILDEPSLDFSLLMPPHEPASLTDHAIGLHVAGLVEDGGTLQIGIGSIGDAIAHALILRQRDNGIFSELLRTLTGETPHECQTQVFDEGLYGLSEMLVEGFLELMEAGVLKREVDGHVMHGSFFIGSPTFYRTLEAMDTALRDKIAMMPVSYVNALYGDEAAKRRGRVKARFINSAIMATLTGAVVSDGLEDGRVISGVGGQYNFVSQAFALEDARSVITLRATRTRRGKTESNIRWSYGHVTIPRHLRDIVVTEYGVADLRGKSDAEVIAEMLNVTDSRFQQGLMGQAKKAGKLPADYTIPPAHRHNTPERITHALRDARRDGHLDTFPLGSDFTTDEQRLVPALSTLRELSGSRRALLRLALAGWRAQPNDNDKACLERMGLATPDNLRERLYRVLVLGALQADNAG